MRGVLAVDYRADRLMRDTSWIKVLKPDEAQVALDALDANKAPITTREAVQLLKLKRALEAKAEGR
jgi:hypothetical protein